MAGLGMAILGGALEQVGTGIADRGKALREAKLKELEQEREFQLRSQEAGVSRDAQVTENKRQEGVQAAENEKNRDAQKTVYGTDAQGNQIMIRGDTSTLVKDADGKPVKMATKSSDTPAEVQTAEWLIKQGIAGSPAKAWELVRGARTDPEKSRASIYKSWLQVLKPAFGNADGEKIQEEALKRTEETMSMLDQADGTDASVGQADTNAAVGDSADVTPIDPTKRTIGRIYRNPNGDAARWTEHGWELVMKKRSAPKQGLSGK